jgi:aconitase B
VLVRFKGKMQPGVTLRDLVHAIPLYAIKAGPADGGQGRQEERLLAAASWKSKACPT